MRRDNSVAHRQRWLFTLLALRKQSTAGFTLIELLVALLISGIMVSVLLSIVVQLLGTNQREAARSDVQRDAQAAIDYIARDLKEAVYVYDGNCLQQGTGSARDTSTDPYTVVCPGLLRSLPSGLEAAGSSTGTFTKDSKQPVLAFWRLEELPASMRTFCDTNAKDIAPPLGTAPLPATDPRTWPPCSTKKMYTLVVYSIDSTNPSSIWRGKSRLTRYKLPQYLDGADAGNKQTAGWVSPIQTGLSFVSWPIEPTKNQNYQDVTQPPKIATDPRPGGGRPTDATTTVLMDFLDNDGTDAVKSGDDDDTKLCPNLPNAPQDKPGGFNVSVRTAKTVATVSRGFYACVRGSQSSADTGNQEVLIRLKANAAGKPGLPLTKADVPFTMETRVMLRGALGKTN